MLGVQQEGKTGRCFPFKFLFSTGNLGKKKDVKNKPSEAATESSGASLSGRSDLMDVDMAGEEGKFPEGMDMATNNAAQGPNRVRMVCGYEIRDTLGKGMSGKVKRGYNPQGNPSTVALKVIDKVKTPRRVLMMLQTEIKAMKALDQHPNILHLLHFELNAVYPKKSGGTRDVVCLALELAEGGELFDFMMYTGAFGEPVAKAIFGQLVSALAFCHQRNIYHRDIKPENLLLDSDYQLKVADFGLAAMRPTAEELLRTECGTRSYMAPEVLARQQYDGSKSDCWSVGVVLFIMLSGNPPFQMARQGDWWFNQLNEGRPDRFWRSHKRYCPNFPEGAQKMLTKIFTTNPANRPAVQDLLTEPWLTSSTLTPQELKQDLMTRKARIAKEKEVEKQRAKKKKAEGGDHKGKEYDPYAKNTHRDVPADGEVAEPVEEAYVAAPAFDESKVKGFTYFYASAKPAYIMERLVDACNAVKGVIGSKAEFSVRAMIPEGGAKVEIEAKIFDVPEEGVQVVEVVKKQGDTVSFNLVYKKLKNLLVDLHGEDMEETSTKAPMMMPGLDADDIELQEEMAERDQLQQKEEVLDDGVGMI